MTWEEFFRGAMAAQGYTLERCEWDAVVGRWSISYTYDDPTSGSGYFEASSTDEVRQMAESLPLVVHPDAREVLWAAHIPLRAAARVGKVHLVNPGAHDTLCGLKVPGPSKMFTPAGSDARCVRCARKAGR